MDFFITVITADKFLRQTQNRRRRSKNPQTGSFAFQLQQIFRFALKNLLQPRTGGQGSFAAGLGFGFSFLG